MQIALDVPQSFPCWSWAGLGGCVKGSRGGKHLHHMGEGTRICTSTGKGAKWIISLLAEDVKSHQSYKEDFTWTCGTLLWMPLTVLPKALHKHERVPNVKVSKSRNPKRVRLWGSEVLGWLSINVLEPRSLGHEAYFGCGWAFLSHSSPSSCSLILKIFGIFFQLNRSLNNMHCFLYQIDDFTFLCREC